MKISFVWLAALLLVFTVQSPAFAAGKAPDKAPANDGCFAHYAEWGTSNQDIKLPQGTSTTIQTCVVGGHQVRINSADWPVSTYQCGAAGPVGQVSAWVDGVKVVDRRNTGEGSLCFDPASNLTTKIIVNDQMHLSVCEALGSSRRGTAYKPEELKTGQHGISVWSDQAEEMEYFIEQCTLKILSPPAGARDPYFNLRTPPGLILFKDSDAMCPVVQARFAGLKREYPADTGFKSALEPYKTDSVTLGGKPYDSASESDKAPGKITHYKLDVDHDGVSDIVTFADKNDKSDMEYPGQYSWTSGKSGKSFNITGAMLHTGILWTSDLYPDPVRDALTFIEAGGKVYLYRAVVGLADSLAISDVEDVETRSGAIDEGASPEASRWLYELRPDGTVRAACQWREVKRPEEFL